MTTICLYCGSREGATPDHADVARRFGTALGEAGMAMVYGGGDFGLMGEAARAAQAAGARVTGFIPRHLLSREVGRQDCDALVVTETMHERKTLMLGNSDATVALSGGPGTLDELIEVLTWRSLGIHGKPTVLVNHGGYWDPLLALFERMEEARFCGPEFARGLEVVDTPEAAVATVAGALRPPRQ